VNRSSLEHLLRAAAAITGEQKFYVVGTAAIVVAISPGESVPDVVTRSREADLIPASGSARSIDLIDGALGQDSTFDGTFGYHADGVEFKTVAYAPADWQQRSIPFTSDLTGGATGFCMEGHDLAIAKLCAGRDKDREFVEGLVQARLVERSTLEARLKLVQAQPEVITLASQRLDALFK